jgi:HEAT repeat protein
MLDSGELPPIALEPLPERPSPDPAAVRGAGPGHGLRRSVQAAAIQLRGARLIRTGRPAPAPQAPAASPVSAFEKLGEDLRDAVAPAPTLERFLAALRDPDPRGRSEAITAFSYSGNFAAIPYVSAVLLRVDEDLAVRVAAARALGRVGDRRAGSFLARAVLDREPQVRLASAIALGLVADPARAAPLSSALQAETDGNVRAALTWALGTSKSRRF